MSLEIGRDIRGARRLTVDVVVIGTGAGGAMAASELARAGLRVCALEEGPWLELSDMSQREDDMLPKLYQDRGARATADRAIRVLSGRCVGGSTVHNMNLCKRTPTQILEQWARDFAVSGASANALDPVFASVERDLSVSEIPSDWRNANNRILERGIRALGWRGGPLSHNRQGCQQSGFCELGCPFNAKQNALKVLVPDALAHGATVMSDAEVRRVVHAGGRVVGVEGVLLDARGQPHAELEVTARAVVLAASAIGSSVLAIKSGLPDPHDRLGRGLHLHPGGAVIGRFDESVEGHRGVPQSYECTELLDLTPGSDKRVWITTAFAHPIGAAVLLPGFGREHARWMASYSKLGVITAMVHDETDGRIRVATDGRASIEYVLGDSDRRQLAQGLSACAELLLAAGAREVMVPAAPSLSVKSKQDLAELRAKVPPGLTLAAVHPLGGLCFGDDPRRSAMTSLGEHHFVRGLFALDGSLFPTSLGVPPQISIYSFARYLCRHVVERLRTS